MGAHSNDTGWRDANLARWDERVPIHAASPNYDLETFRQGQDVIPPFEAAEVGDVTGLTVAHLQCHMGQDTLSWARRGAKRVVGLDFSPAAIEQARALAAHLGYGPDAAEFVVADVYDAAAAMPDPAYDLVYVSCGAIDWLPDIRRWAETAASLVRPGGFLYVSEFHPLHFSLDDATGSHVLHSYFRAEPLVHEDPGSYADRGAATVHNTSHQWVHPLGDVVSAIAAAGLRVEFLHEHDKSVFARFANMSRAADGYFRFPPGAPTVPLMYTLKAVKAA
jgi:SAM-dependent methyltransferase